MNTPKTIVVLQTFRIFRRSENRGSFGHRRYYLMNREGIAFLADRVYDLPLNGEVQVPVTMEEGKRPEDEYAWNFGALSFECQERLHPDAPKNVIDLVFKEAAVPTDVHAVSMT